MRVRLWVIALSGLLLLAWSFTAAHADGQPFVAGDLIVKFASASEPGAQVARALQDGPAADRRLAVLATQLSQELGIALTAVRVTSGSELVLSVDRERLLQSLTRLVSRDPAVRAVTRVAAPKTVLPAARIELALDLRRDSEAARLARDSARAGKQTSPEIETLVRKLCAGADPQPSGRVSDRGQLVLVIDVAALTLDLIGRLERRPDVEYAQPSQVLRPFNGAVLQKGAAPVSGGFREA